MSKEFQYFLIFIIFISFHKETALSQSEDSIKVVDRPTVIYGKDTVDTSNFQTIDDMIKNQPVSNQNFEMKKSPFGAVWRSLLLPGLGQIYVESYWKAPLFTAGAGVLVYFIITNNNKFIEYKDKYDETLKTNPNDYNLMIFRSKREFYRDNRDQSVFFLAAVYILAAVDAYVGAHLYDFDVSDVAKLNLLPIKYGGVSFNLSIFFNK